MILILISWAIIGVIPYQLIILRSEFQKPVRYYVTWVDLFKAIPFGPIPFFAVIDAYLILKIRKWKSTY